MPAMAAGESKKAILAAMFANGGLAIAKFVAWGLTRSGSMLAEATHSVADTGNQVLLLVGESRAKRGPTKRRPFGSSREAYFMPFIVAIILFTLGAGFAAHEGIEKLRHPEELGSLRVAVIVLVIGIVLETGSFATAIRAANPLREGATWWRFIRSTKAASLAVVLLEDAAALIGLVLALIGVSLAAATGDPMWDAIGTLTIAALLASVAVLMAMETHSLLIGEAPDADEDAALRNAILAEDGIDEIIVLRAEHRGPEDLLVTAKVRVDPDLTASALAERIGAAERRARDAVPAARYMFIEPEI